jgi:riboflavin biosynthesis pyrimidine reductase
VKRLLCEGGGALNEALFRAGVVDEVYLTISQVIFGGRDAPTLADGKGIDYLADATHLKLKSYRRIGDELFLVFKAKKKVR